jgi:hypothetical protein
MIKVVKSSKNRHILIGPSREEGKAKSSECSCVSFTLDRHKVIKR